MTTALDQTPTITSGYDGGEQLLNNEQLTVIDGPKFWVRVLSGLRLKRCQSCQHQPGIYTVQFTDLIITVCYGCLP